MSPPLTHLNILSTLDAIDLTMNFQPIRMIKLKYTQLKFPQELKKNNGAYIRAYYFMFLKFK